MKTIAAGKAILKQLRPWQMILLACLLALAAGCIEEISLNAGETGDQIVVFGTFSDQAGPVTLRITTVAPFGTQQQDPPVEGAQVTLLDEQGRREAFAEVSPGVYACPREVVKSQYGKSYSVEIRLQNGKIIRSTPEKMPQPLPVDSLYVTREETTVPRRVYAQCYADVAVPAGSGGVYLRWATRFIYQRTEVDLVVFFMDSFRFKPPKRCYMTEQVDPQIVPVFGSNRSDAFLIEGQAIARRVLTNDFFERSCFEVVQYRTTQQAHKYWNDIRQVANQQGNTFDPPPAAIRGNLFNPDDKQELILGYFEVAAIDTARVFMDRAQFDPIELVLNCNQDFSDPRNWNTYGFPPVCVNCLLIPNSTLARPPFWRP